MPASPACPAGVIEGFYGAPWSREERLILLSWMQRAGLTQYLHAPKDDPHHRSAWRDCYPDADAARIAHLAEACRSRGIDFVWGVSPGLDIRYSSSGDMTALLGRFEQLASMGCRHFAILFDDIPDTLCPADLARFGSLAACQASVANLAHAWMTRNTPGGRLLVCPTPYCSRMAAAGLGGPRYLETLGEHLAAAIGVFWTGPEIISAEIGLDHIAQVTALLRRPPVIWDNLFANDYDGSRFFSGPYSGRPRLLREKVAGLFINPNNELPLNFLPLHSLGRFVHGEGNWDPRQSFLDGVKAWLPAFKLLDSPAGLPPRRPVSLDELVLLADCFYLPQQYGPGAATLLEGAKGLLEKPPAAWGALEESARIDAGRLKDLCHRLTDLADRGLLQGLLRRLWPLREECTLLVHRVENRLRASREEKQHRDDDHLPGTFRGGFLADLQRIVPAPWIADPTTAVARSGGTGLRIRRARPEDEAAANLVCLGTGADGADGTPFYADDPQALARIFVGPYFAFAPDLAWVLEDGAGVCGYCLAAANSAAFIDRYEREWRPRLAARFPQPTGDPATWTRTQQVHHLYHHPDHQIPEPRHLYPAHIHIDLLPRAQGQGWGRKMMTTALDELSRHSVPGVHLGVGTANHRAQAFYRRIGFTELCRVGGDDGCTFMGLRLDGLPGAGAGPERGAGGG